MNSLTIYSVWGVLPTLSEMLHPSKRMSLRLVEDVFRKVLLLTRQHLRRETGQRWRPRSNWYGISTAGRLACEVCGFDFLPSTAKWAEGLLNVTTRSRSPMRHLFATPCLRILPSFVPTATGCCIVHSRC